jgi:hypothetical protein
MVQPGETIFGTDVTHCDKCGCKLPMKVLSTSAGYYIGTQCDCGPYSRESGYFATQINAELALVRWGEGKYINKRS